MAPWKEIDGGRVGRDTWFRVDFLRWSKPLRGFVCERLLCGVNKSAELASTVA